MRIRPGDLIEVMNDEGESWYGEVVGKQDGLYEVYYISTDNGILYTYDQEYNTVDKACIITHVRNHYNYKDAWASLGFNMDYDTNGSMFMTKSNDEVFALSPVRSLDTDSTYTSGSESINSVDTWSSSEEESQLDNNFNIC